MQKYSNIETNAEKYKQKHAKIPQHTEHMQKNTIYRNKRRNIQKHTQKYSNVQKQMQKNTIYRNIRRKTHAEIFKCDEEIFLPDCRDLAK